MLFNQTQTQRTDKQRGVTLAFGDVAGQLRRVHGLRRGKVSIFAQVVNGGERQQRKNGQDEPHCAGPFADFKFVNPFL